MKPSAIEIMAEYFRGIYQGQFLAETMNWELWKGVKIRTLEILLDGPHHNEEYWDALDDLMIGAYYTNDRGDTWHLYHDGTVYAVCEELMTEVEMENFGCTY